MPRKQPQKIHHSKNTSSHILAHVRREIGARLKESRDDLGLAPDTVKSITSGRSPFTMKSAQTVSRTTGVAVDCLLENDPAKPLIAVTGKRWNKAFYERFKTGERQAMFQEQQAPQHTATRLINNQRILSLKLARALVAAYEAGQSDLAAFKIHQALRKVENDILDSNPKKAEAKHALQHWDISVQIEIGRIEPSTRNMPKRWGVIWKNFYSKVNAIYSQR